MSDGIPQIEKGLGGAPWLRLPMSWLYAGGRRAHRGLYDFGLKRRSKLPKKVVCVGNLTVGGTGKTPFIIHLVNELVRRGRRPVILSRGYGAVPPAEQPRIVSDGDKPCCTTSEAGDEPMLMALRCPGVPVVIGTNRYEAGMAAMDQFDPDLFVLDDGFQHEALAREVDLVLWDARDVPSRMRQLPAGRLREALSALGRATALVITHAEYLSEAERSERLDQIRTELKVHAPQASIIEADSNLDSYYPLAEVLDAAPISCPISELAGRRALLVSALARPDGFEALARRARIEIAGHVIGRDHAEYGPREIDDMRRQAEAAGADFILTTEKDAVKLAQVAGGGLPVFVATLAMQWDQSPGWALVMEKILE